MKVIGGIVPSHESDDHEWIQAALKASKGSLERERYIFRDGLDPTWTSLPRAGSSRRTRTLDKWRNVFKYSRCRAPLGASNRKHVYAAKDGLGQAFSLDMLVFEYDPASFCKIITESLGLRCSLCLVAHMGRLKPRLRAPCHAPCP